MQVRGAPLIAIVGVLSLTIELGSLSASVSAADVRELIHARLDNLRASRPTAVNMANAVAVLRGVVDSAAGKADATTDTIKKAYKDCAEEMWRADRADNEAIGEAGARWLVQQAGDANAKIAVLTHCNTG
jgi:methylthioribose-1-phosphate isomerase